MKKNSAMPFLVAIYSVVLGLYSVLVFSVFAPPRLPVFWISYTATCISYVLSFVLSVLVFVKNISPTKRFLGIPLHQTGFFYAVFQTFASLIFMGVREIPLLVSTLIQIFLLGVTVVGAAAVQGARRYIETVDNTVQAKRETILEMADQLHLLEMKTGDQAVRNSLHRAYEKIRYSDPMSLEQLEVLECQMQTTVQELQASVVSGQQNEIDRKCQELCHLADQRNSMCKLYKGKQ